MMEVMETYNLSDPQSRQQDAHQEDPRSPDLRLQGQPHRGGRPHHREGNLQVEKQVMLELLISRIHFPELQSHLEPLLVSMRLSR